MLRRLLLAAFLAVTPQQSHAGSAWPSFDISVLEIINDGASELAPICMVSVYDVGRPDMLLGKCMISFARKWTWNWHLVLQGTPDKFHVLHPIYGSPVIPYDIWDDGHHTTTSGWVGMWLPRNQGLFGGGVTHLIAKDNVGPNYVLIDAR